MLILLFCTEAFSNKEYTTKTSLAMKKKEHFLLYKRKLFDKCKSFIYFFNV